MTSTNNKNTPGNYNLQQRNFDLARIYNKFENSQYWKAYHETMPSVGITPSHMPRDTLSYNPIEIETALFGINSTNLVSPRAPLQPKLKNVEVIDYFDRLPIILPKPLVIENKQRPFPIGN